MTDFGRTTAPTSLLPGGTSPAARMRDKLAAGLPQVDHNGREIPDPDQVLLAEAVALGEAADLAAASPTGMQPNPAQGASASPAVPTPAPTNVRDAIRAQAAKHGR